MATVQELATQARCSFEFTGENHPTMRDNIWITKDDKPDWLSDMIRDAGHHNADILPDDWCYEMVVNALDTIIEADASEPGFHGDDLVYDASFEHVSIYTHELLDWLTSHSSRLDMVDEAVEINGWPGTLIEAIQYAQREEIYEIFQSVYHFLANLADGAEDNVDDSEGDEA